MYSYKWNTYFKMIILSKIWHKSDVLVTSLSLTYFNRFLHKLKKTKTKTKTKKQNRNKKTDMGPTFHFMIPYDKKNTLVFSLDPQTLKFGHVY